MFHVRTWCTGLIGSVDGWMGGWIKRSQKETETNSKCQSGQTDGIIHTFINTHVIWRDLHKGRGECRSTSNNGNKKSGTRKLHVEDQIDAMLCCNTNWPKRKKNKEFSPRIHSYLPSYGSKSTYVRTKNISNHLLNKSSISHSLLLYTLIPRQHTNTNTHTLYSYTNNTMGFLKNKLDQT